MRDRNTSADALQFILPFLLLILGVGAVAQAISDGAGCSCREMVAARPRARIAGRSGR